MAEKRELTPYAKKLLDPRWQKMRLVILDRDKFTCQNCWDTTKTLHVHHRIYIRGRDPWDYDENLLVTLCETCHELEGEFRAQEESQLVESLKHHYLSSDLSHASTLLVSMGLFGPVPLRAAAWYLSDEQRVLDLIELWRKENRPLQG